MILTRMRIHNFRQYRDLQQIEFATDDSRNTTIVTGPNGSGKTSIFLALNWCLYGEVDGARGSLIAKTTSKSLDDGFVEVHFQHDGRKYRARRDVKLRPDGSEYDTGLDLIALDATGQPEAVANPIAKLNTILPSTARPYFFFDGERMDELTKPDHSDRVRDAARSVLKMEVLERAISHLGSVQQDFSKQAKQVSDLDARTANLLANADDLELLIAELETDVRKRTAELAATNRMLAGYEQALRDSAQAKQHREHLDRLSASIRSSTETLEAAVDDLRTSLPVCSNLNALEAAESALALLEEKRLKGEIPSNIKHQLIEDLLSEGRCLCGRHIDDEARAALEALGETTTSAEVEGRALQLSGLLKSMVAQGGPDAERLRGLLKRRMEATTGLDDLHRESQEVTAKLTQHPDVDVRELQQQINQLHDGKADLDQELGALRERLSVAGSARTKNLEEVQKISRNSQAAREAVNRFDLAARAHAAAVQMLETYKADTRSRIEETADRVFKELIWKSDHFTRVAVSDEYRLDVVDRYNSSAIDELSAGEREVLSLAFIIAMAQTSGDDAPLVIDTPFGRISEEPLEAIAQRLPSLTTQLILLVTDSELTDEARAILDPTVGKEYVLDFDDATGATQVMEVDRIGR